MSVGVMKDYKLKQRDLRASHTLGWCRGNFFSIFFSPVFPLSVTPTGSRPVPPWPTDCDTAVAEMKLPSLNHGLHRCPYPRTHQGDRCREGLCCLYGWGVQGCFRTYPERVSLGAVFRVSGPRDGWLVEKRWIHGGVYQDAGQRDGRRGRFRDGVE